ncbi:MAG: hypothetical protein HZY75_12145 [Nocardioidaceae bacterium]|nr:MAG: hypothetical protein HZY75_12145 [Nocardioidaceae bacterium]
MHTNLRRILCLSGLVLSAALLVGMPPAYAAETGDEFEGERVVWIPVEGVIATRDGENPWSGNRGLAGLCDGEGPCGYLVQNQAGPGQTGVDARVELVPGTGGYTFEGVVPAVRYFDANAGWGEATVPYELEISVKVTLTGDTYRVEGRRRTRGSCIPIAARKEPGMPSEPSGLSKGPLLGRVRHRGKTPGQHLVRSLVRD